MLYRFIENTLIFSGHFETEFITIRYIYFCLDFVKYIIYITCNIFRNILLEIAHKNLYRNKYWLKYNVVNELIFEIQSAKMR